MLMHIYRGGINRINILYPSYQVLSPHHLFLSPQQEASTVMYSLVIIYNNYFVFCCDLSTITIYLYFQPANQQHNLTNKGLFINYVTFFWMVRVSYSAVSVFSLLPPASSSSSVIFCQTPSHPSVILCHLLAYPPYPLIG